MMRVITWRQVSTPPVAAGPGAAIAAFNELTAAVGKVSGVGDNHWGFGNGGIVTISHYDNYAVTDAILKNPGVQAAVIKIFAMGVGIGEDVFVVTPQQVMPFLPPQ